MTAVLPRHGPMVVEVSNAFYRQLNDQKRLKEFGCKSGSRFYVAQILCVRNDMRSAGIGSRLLNEAMRYAKEKRCDFMDFISIDGTVSKMCQKREFQVVDQLPYGNFKLNDECPFENIDCEHSSGIHFLKKL